MVKVTRTGQSKAKKLLDKLISEEEFMARKPSAKDIEAYKMIKRELEIGAKEGFVSKITISPSPKSKTKKSKAAKVKR